MNVCVCISLYSCKHVCIYVCILVCSVGQVRHVIRWPLVVYQQSAIPHTAGVHVPETPTYFGTHAWMQLCVCTCECMNVITSVCLWMYWDPPHCRYTLVSHTQFFFVLVCMNISTCIHALSCVCMWIYAWITSANHDDWWIYAIITWA